MTNSKVTFHPWETIAIESLSDYHIQKRYKSSPEGEGIEIKTTKNFPSGIQQHHLLEVVRVSASPGQPETITIREQHYSSRDPEYYLNSLCEDRNYLTKTIIYLGLTRDYPIRVPVEINSDVQTISLSLDPYRISSIVSYFLTWIEVKGIVSIPTVRTWLNTLEAMRWLSLGDDFHLKFNLDTQVLTGTHDTYELVFGASPEHDFTAIYNSYEDRLNIHSQDKPVDGLEITSPHDLVPHVWNELVKRNT